MSDDIFKTLEKICEDYKNNDYINTKLQNLITNLPQKLESSYNNHLNVLQKQEDTRNLIHECVNNFFNNYLFFYHNNNREMYFLYENNTFRILNDNDFSVFIYDYINKLGNTELMYKHKYKVENTIIKMVKKQPLTTAIPTSETIQNTIRLFFPYHFKSRELVKLFLINLGNNIQKQNRENMFLASTQNKLHLSSLSSYINNITGSGDVLLNIKYKYMDQENIKFLPMNFELHNSHNIFDHIIDVIVVACHYSNRFKIEDFIKKSNKKLKASCNKFKFPVKLMDDFRNRYLTSSSDHYITKENMYFLWKLYEHEELLPQVYSKKKLLEELSNMMILQGNIFIHLRSCLLDEIEKFVHFFRDAFSIPGQDEFEIDEIISIYSSKENVEINDMTPEIAMKSLELHISRLHIQNRKICNISCLHWNKSVEVKAFISSYNKSRTPIKSSYNAYQNYSTSDKYPFKVNKAYFEILYSDAQDN